MEQDEQMMREALKEARAAREEGEVPIGAVVACKGRIIAKGHNMTERLCDPTAHAEMIALTAATEALGGKYLQDCTIYVSVEPCPMCAGGIINSRIPTVVFGAKDENTGSCGSVINLFEERYGHKPAVFGGVKAQQSADLLKSFFNEKRTSH